MAAAEGVEQIRHREVDVSLFAWRQRLGFFPAIAELGAERLAAQQLLVAAHLQRRRIQNTLVCARCLFLVRVVVGIYINQLHHKIGVGAGAGNLQLG